MSSRVATSVNPTPLKKDKYLFYKFALCRKWSLFNHATWQVTSNELQHDKTN